MKPPMFVQPIGSNPKFEENVLVEGEKKLVMGIGAVFQDPEMNLAFQKAMEMGWIRLWDIQPVLPNPQLPPGPPNNVPVPCRIFKITNSGQDRLNELRRKREIDERMNHQ